MLRVCADLYATSLIALHAQTTEVMQPIDKETADFTNESDVEECEVYSMFMNRPCGVVTFLGLCSRRATLKAEIAPLGRGDVNGAASLHVTLIERGRRTWTTRLATLISYNLYKLPSHL